ncbi:MAG: bifunctional phosphoribosylaminoimidazolecarboxamide formyltransferase/IMP cyclohydrolase [Bacteroidota bacterium]
MVKIQRALISVYHKEGLEPLVNSLHTLGVEIYSTGGTATFIQSLGIPVIEVASKTGYPSILGGRVKTLHPVIHGGILARREEQADQEELAAYDIPPIDLVIVDLYPFEETLRQTDDSKQIIEKIDIGGIALIRAAAKNFQHVWVVSSQSQYGEVERMLTTQTGSSSLEQRKDFAAHAYKVSSSYDQHIHQYLSGQKIQQRVLRYGENPHQKGTFEGNLSELFTQIQGKALSFNNLVDIDAAVALVQEFEEPCFAVIKHTNPCGCAIDSDLSTAWEKALAGDPISAFGGILACNGKIDESLARKIGELFFEVLIAREFTEEALAFFQQKKNRILLRQEKPYTPNDTYKFVLNGTLRQEVDQLQFSQDAITVQTSRQPTQSELRDAWFGDTVCKHLKSNAIAIVKDCQIIGTGMGQTSRIDALKQAVQKAKFLGFSLKGSVLASDAFFPFADCVTLAKENGIEVVVEPGGSKRDQESINYCENQDMCLIFTGTRHFKH